MWWNDEQTFTPAAFSISCQLWKNFLAVPTASTLAVKARHRILRVCLWEFWEVNRQTSSSQKVFLPLHKTHPTIPRWNGKTLSPNVSSVVQIVVCFSLERRDGFTLRGSKDMIPPFWSQEAQFSQWKKKPHTCNRIASSSKHGEKSDIGIGYLPVQHTCEVWHHSNISIGDVCKIKVT